MLLNYMLWPILDELDPYQAIVMDARIMKNYCVGLAAAKFVNTLRPKIGVQLHGVVIGGDTLDGLTSTLPLVPS